MADSPIDGRQPPLPSVSASPSGCIAAILTWNDPASCLRTVHALQTAVTGIDHIVIYDNGSIDPFALFAPVTNVDRITIVRGPTNLGAGGGVTRLMQATLVYDPKTILYIEDDFVCHRALALAPLLDVLANDPFLGRIALGDRGRRPKPAYFTFGAPAEEIAAAAAQVDRPIQHTPELGDYQRLRLGWSNYPCLIPAIVARRYLLSGWTETRCAKEFYADGWETISLLPGYFTQIRAHHRLRAVPDWRY